MSEFGKLESRELGLERLPFDLAALVTEAVASPTTIRRVSVLAARVAANTAGAELAIPGLLWCSATQWR